MLLAAEPAVIKGLSHHALFLLLVQLCLLLLVARLLGELMRKVQQPPVIGELLAGVLLGPSIFGHLAPELAQAIFPREQYSNDLLSVVAWIGVLLLLIVTGLETDIELILSRGRTAMTVSFFDISIPFALGFLMGHFIPDAYLADPDQRLVFSLFLAVALSISAVPVLAKVLLDLKIIRRDIGQLALATAMTDDLVGWIMLSVVAGLATSGQVDLGSLAKSGLGAMLFITFCFTMGRLIVQRILRWVEEAIGGTAAQVTVILVLGFGSAAFTHFLGIEAVLGAFMVGILAGQARRVSMASAHALEVVTTAFLAPIFFATAGLKVDLAGLLNPTVMGLGAIILLIACLGKFAGCYLGGTIGGLSHWERLALGSGMNARGALEIIVATVGLSLGVLGPEMYAIIVMVAIATSMMAPPMMRYTLSKVALSPEEQTRLEQDRLAEVSFVRRIRRILVPTRGGANAEQAALLIQRLRRSQNIDMTLLYVKDGDNQDPDKATRSLVTRLKPPPRVKVVEAAGDTSDTILEEARRGYDLLVLGATGTNPDSASLFNTLVDRLIQDSPCPSVVVRSGVAPVEALRKILVPTVGTQYSGNALEMAAGIAHEVGALVTVMHVVTPPDSDHQTVDPRLLDRMRDIATGLVDHQADLGRKLGAEVDTRIVVGGEAEDEILELAHEEGYDLIMLGSNLRPISGRAFFGHRVDRILRSAECAVAVVSATS